MDWKSTKILLASAATIIVASKLVRKLYNNFFGEKPSESDKGNETCSDLINMKNREINDVILFSDDVIRHTIKVPPNRDITICESRELNCFKLMKYIKSARETLDVCMYLITSSEIAEQIIRLGQKHVLVRIVVDSDMAHTPPSQIKKLKEYSFIQVQTSKKSILMHHKFCVIDGPKAIKRKNLLKAYAEKLNVHAQFMKSENPPRSRFMKGFVMSGSLNWSTQAMVSNRESVIVTSHPNIVSKFEKEFESLWVENQPDEVLMIKKRTTEIKMCCSVMFMINGLNYCYPPLGGTDIQRVQSPISSSTYPMRPKTAQWSQNQSTSISVTAFNRLQQWCAVASAGAAATVETTDCSS
ncbi:hypothetical protein K1T71_006331 [Dendrolimus kikuchii]|uniref:Uncharacterized protein n=1 Tax=Dendrolimus kikuchii TaxID=765133 RepID=A0ACC1D3L0_9NEOP|nr:hypothetical protein K1T71_006331 [Dendrolimus kikuchii]